MAASAKCCGGADGGQERRGTKRQATTGASNQSPQTHPVRIMSGAPVMVVELMSFVSAGLHVDAFMGGKIEWRSMVAMAVVFLKPGRAHSETSRP